jgi:NAD(P)-dependent dehydrogenase (short-subunit alcohol dehydrogenase family)
MERPGVVAVTGASSGIGRATAVRFLRRGWRVAVMARRGALLAELLAAEGAEADGRGWACGGDATRLEDMEAFIDGTVARLGGLDAVVLNVGLNVRRRALTELSPEDWRRVQATNLDAAYYGTRAALPHLRRQGGGLLIYISSVGALEADASGAAYQAAKHGITGLANAVRFEEQRHGVRVSVIFPGMVNTPLVLERPVVPSPAQLAACLQPEDVAACCTFIAEQGAHVVIPELVIRPARL